MKKLVLLVAVAVSLFAGQAMADCYGDCGSDQGICISRCDGNGQCIADCAQDHGRCVSRCGR